MSNYIRPKIAGTPVFFTLNLAHRGTSLLVDNIKTLRHAFTATMAERPFTINAIVILPDHLHTVLTLPDTDYATRWRIIKARFSREVPKGHVRPSHVARKERGVWQRRYWEHHIRNERDYRKHVEYCWLNPVKHGLVERPSAWPHSSIHRDIRQGTAPPRMAITP